MSSILNSNNTDSKSLSIVLLYTTPAIGFVGYSLFKINKAKETWFRMSQYGKLKRMFLGLGLGLSFGSSFGSAVYLSGIALRSIPRIPKMEESSSLKDIRKAPYLACLGSPVLEEISFRGCLLPIFIRILGQTGGIFGTSILFGSAHLLGKEPSEGGRYPFSMNPTRICQAVNATATGVLLGYIYVYFGLFTAIGMHIGNNTAVYTIDLFRKTSNLTE